VSGECIDGGVELGTGGCRTLQNAISQAD
jgi:hypothetical protein